MHSWVLINFIFQNSDSVSIKCCSLQLTHWLKYQIKMLIKKSIKMLIKNQSKNQSKCQVSTLIKMSLILYTAGFYSPAGRLWLRVKRVTDWVRCSTIHSKIDWNSKACFSAIKMKTCDFILALVCEKQSHLWDLKLHSH